MPPFPKSPDGIMWKYIERDVKRIHDNPTNGKSWRVVVIFTRIGERVDNQERVLKTLDTYTVAEKLGPNQALDMQHRLQKVCDESYQYGYGDGQGYHP